MILRAPCIIDFIGANGLLGAVGGEGALDTPGPLNGIERSPKNHRSIGNFMQR
jgi:hypothetical protein